MDNIIIINTIQDAEKIIRILLENKYVITTSAIYGEYPYENRLKYIEIEYYREDLNKNGNK